MSRYTNIRKTNDCDQLNMVHKTFNNYVQTTIPMYFKPDDNKDSFKSKRKTTVHGKTDGSIIEGNFG